MTNRRFRFTAVLLSGVCGGLATAAAGPVLAAPGDLDRAFGAAGRVEESFGGAFPGSEKVVSSAALQGDGKIVVAGSTSAQGGRLVLARFRTDGSPDPAFGDRGLANLPLRVRTGDVLIQPDGKIVTAGTGADRRFALTRHNSDGSLDRTFGDGGRVETQLGDSSGASAVVLQEDGKLVAAGWSYDDEVPSFALARYNADGSLDPTFGAAGKVRTPWPGWYGAGASDLVRDPNARLVVAGEVNSGHKGWSYFALARYTANGALDPSFGSGGTVRGPEGGASTLLGVPTAL